MAPNEQRANFGELTGNIAEIGDAFVGRSDELCALRDALSKGARTIGLVGPPGSGKTRLAIEGSRQDGTPSKCWLLDMSGTRTVEDVLISLAGTLSLPWEDASRRASLFDAIARGGRSWLVFDACDRIAGPSFSALLDDLADACPQQILVVTSRTKLAGLHETIDVMPLPLTDAVKLFEVRAGSPTDTQRAVVEDLVERLDRLPLAIELAAARASVLNPADIVSRLEHRFSLLSDSSRGRALERTVEWAWEGLTDSERTVLAQTSVFAGAFSLDDAEAIVELSDEDAWIVDVVSTLVEGSMLRRASTRGGKARFAHYETIRAFAVQDAAWEPVVRAARERHTAHFATFPRRMFAAAQGGDGGRAVTEIDAIFGELQAVFDRSLSKDPEVAAELAASLAEFLRRSARGAVAARFFDAALSLPEISALHRARLLLARGELRTSAGDLEAAREDFTRAIRAGTEAESPPLEARATFRLGSVERRRGHPEEALMLLGQSSEYALNSGDDDLRRLVAAHLACCHVDLGATGRARELLATLQSLAPIADARLEAEALKRMSYAQFYLANYEEQHRLGLLALDQSRRAGDLRLEALSTHGLGDSALQLGRVEEAREYYEEALPRHRELGDHHYVGVLLGNLGTLHHQSGRLGEAVACYREALETHRRTGARPYEAVVLFALGVLEAERGHLDEALHQQDVALALNEELELDDDVGAVQMARAWLFAEKGEFEQARDSLRAAASAFECSGAEAWRAVAESARCVMERWIERSAERSAGHSTLEEFSTARAAVDQFGGETESALIDLVERLGTGAETDATLFATHPSLHVRALARLASRIDVVSAAVSPSAAGSVTDVATNLRLSSDGTWFEIDSTERVDLRRRRSLRLILLELVERFVRGGEDLGVYDAFDVGWPGETASVEASADRVYWAVGTLRKLGLQELIVTTDEGYHLDPAARIEVVDE